MLWLLPLRWRHNGRDGVSNHQPNDCLLNRLFRRRSKNISKLCITGLCAGNSPATGEFPAQMASNAENVSIWWRHHASPGHKKPLYRLCNIRALWLKWRIKNDFERPPHPSVSRSYKMQFYLRVFSDKCSMIRIDDCISYNGNGPR